MTVIRVRCDGPCDRDVEIGVNQFCLYWSPQEQLYSFMCLMCNEFTVREAPEDIFASLSSGGCKLIAVRPPKEYDESYQQRSTLPVITIDELIDAHFELERFESERLS